MGQTSSKSRRASDSSTAPLNQPLRWRQSTDTSNGFAYDDRSADSLSGTNAFPAGAPFEPRTSITRPAPPPRLHRVSELIDPFDLISHCPEGPERRNPRAGETPKMSYKAEPDVNKRLPPLVESPSGNVLGAQEFLAHPNRPLAIRERQESIRRALEEAEREESEKAQGTRRSSEGTWHSQREAHAAAHGGFGAPTDTIWDCLPGREKGNYRRIRLAEEREAGCCFGCFGR